MRLADRIAQCRIPFIVENTITKQQVRLMGAADFSSALLACPTRYCLSDDLVGLCTALAYSKGARTLACADLLHIPGERVWIEWCEAPWINELNRYGFRSAAQRVQSLGRRGAFIQSSPQGRRGLIRSFWANGDNELEVLASSMEAYFDFDTEVGEDPVAPDGQNRSTINVFDSAAGNAEISRHCFRFRYERSWQSYYEQAQLSPSQRDAIARHGARHHCDRHTGYLSVSPALGTRPGLPRRALMLERLNEARMKSGEGQGSWITSKSLRRCCLNTGPLGANPRQAILVEVRGFTTCADT